MAATARVIHPLTEARKTAGVSMRDLAVALNCNKSSISRIESRKHLPSPDLADRIAKYLGGTLRREQLLFPDEVAKKPVRSVR